jgi:hypothetical protein
MHGKCSQCGNEGKIEEHHTSYFPEVKIKLCVSCHKKKHYGKNRKKLDALRIQAILSDKAAHNLRMVRAKYDLTNEEALNKIIEFAGETL